MHIATIVVGSIKVFIRSFFVLGFLQWFNFWFIAHRECEIKIDTIRMFIRGGRFHRKVVDMFVAIYCIIDREYFPKGFEIKSTDTVVDIGGHIGSFTLAAAREAREGKVYTFEPDALNFGMLKKNIELNRFSNVTLVNQAIGARTEERVFYRNELNDSSSSFTRVVGAGFTIRTSSLADAFATHMIERCDFMKM
ncbi:MAG: FkbM family methyltransferase, partial [Methylomonas sp.]|nr:FkbM family methyltransferase [Methylomonas sp.]